MRLAAILVIVLACAPVQGSAQTPPPFYLDVAAFPQAAADVLTTTNDPSVFGNRDRLWEFRSGGARDLGRGIVVSADVVGRRGYRVDVVNASVVDMSQRRVDWTVKLRIEKTFVRSKWTMRLVGELMAPLGDSVRTVVSPSAGFFDSRAVSIG